MLEVRWHGRGGQGAKTAAQLLALAGLAGGRSVQAFPEYGPERTGAPVLAYTRIDDRPIRRHCGVTEPDVVVVLDPSLAGEVDVTGGLKAHGVVLVNAERLPDALAGAPAVAIPGDRIAREAGSRYANTAMVGAMAGYLGLLPLGALLEAAEELFAARPAALAGARRGLEAGYAAGEGRRRDAT